ncbi:hypothetical protein NPIL_411301 [Nephila pilipes]|uniref:Uncharacterized protein n=1 Tax=Nephila pilipes TaxID=299642 RepID=A0A8X6IKX3_NEPPI|nr:hypothetical protein NPIL_411301 [Nephila pilipes]
MIIQDITGSIADDISAEYLSPDSSTHKSLFYSTLLIYKTHRMVHVKFAGAEILHVSVSLKCRVASTLSWPRIARRICYKVSQIRKNLWGILEVCVYERTNRMGEREDQLGPLGS